MLVATHMMPRFPSILSTACASLLLLLPAEAQTSYSPASPNTSNPFTSSASLPPRPISPRQATAVQPGLPGTSLSAVPGGYVASAQVMTSEPIEPNHKLGRGDRLSYYVVEDREPNQVWPLIVGDDGEVNLPLGGRVKAAGKTTDQLRTDIKGLLEREYYYHATINMGLDAVAQRASRGRIYVTGAVRQTGPVELPVDAPMTASQAIYQMGGPVDFSALKKTRVMRKGGPKEGILVNVKAVEKGDLDKDVVLQPGDTVIVPEASIGIRL